jgi:hypothetical protein
MKSVLRKCEICRGWIEPERLELVRNTQLCATHAQEIAKYGGEFTTVSKEDRSQKAGSLKINIAGVTTKMIRNPFAIEKLQREFEIKSAESARRELS